MEWIAALLGWATGVAVNVVADSLPVTRRVARPACPACGAPRPWPAWSAIAGALSGARRCAYCGRRRSWRALVVELASAVGAVWLWHHDPTLAGFGQGFLVAAVLLLIGIIDLEHRLILHAVSFPAALLVGAAHALDPARGVTKTLLGGAAGFVLVLGLYLLGGLFARGVARLRRRPLEEVAFGFGDVTLSAVIGLAVGWPGVVLALLLGVLAAGLFSLGYVGWMLVRRRYSAFTPIPYGPFLILGAWAVYFGGRAAFQPLLGG